MKLKKYFCTHNTLGYSKITKFIAIINFIIGTKTDVSLIIFNHYELLPLYIDSMKHYFIM